jgi:hypothetical protein
LRQNIPNRAFAEHVDSAAHPLTVLAAGRIDYNQSMKVFWSWQSDTPAKIGRDFVRDALEIAISELKQTPDIDEALRGAYLDHDWKGVSGSPSLVDTILSKIEAASVFIADVTPVGVVSSSNKKLINSNVAIEFGYALRCLGDRRLLMIMNSHYGRHSDLPFDLQHKAGPILYELPETASPDDIRRAKKQLVYKLKDEISEVAKISNRDPAEPFPEAQPIEDNPGVYFDQSEPIVYHSPQEQFFFTSSAVTYIRLIPTERQKSLKKVEAQELARSDRHLQRFSVCQSSGNNPRTNAFGAINYDCGLGKEIDSASQLFTTGEIWGFDGLILKPENGRFRIPTEVHEQAIARCLYDYVRFASEKLGFKPPFYAEIGMSNVKGYVLLMSHGRERGPITQKHVTERTKLNSCDPKEIDAFLLNFFEAIFDAAGCLRPKCYNDFPGKEPGCLPSS